MEDEEGLSPGSYSGQRRSKELGEVWEYSPSEAAGEKGEVEGNVWHEVVYFNQVCLYQ